MRLNFRTTIAGRLVRVVAGTNTQTVNICTAANQIGAYEAIYRFPITSAIDDTELVSLLDLEELREWLEMRNGEFEAGSTTVGNLGLAKRIRAPRSDDAWLQEAIAGVERAITQVVRDFMKDPLMHRVEHSIHARLWSLLTAQSIFKNPVAIGSTGMRTQLVHKEWPETLAEVAHHRGLFDLAILSPQQLVAASRKQFRQGRIDAPIVIEVGLDYGYKHLLQDHWKLLNSRVVAPYLIHLSRLHAREVLAETLICNPKSPVRTAYVHHPSNGRRAVKNLNDSRVSTRR
ncbi:MAG TPA: hypothetical protein VFC12_03765 [Terriglobales bacterium]|nr:hypothetical protein [Terriglobales bacterium]